MCTAHTVISVIQWTCVFKHGAYRLGCVKRGQFLLSEAPWSTHQVLTRFLPGAAAPDSNDGTDVAYTA